MEENDFDKNWCIVVLKFLGLYWRGVFMLIWPFVSALVFLIDVDAKIRCLFVVILMAGYWVTECIPLGITGMLPVVLLPLLAIRDTGKVCINYFNSTNMIFMASMLIATGIEHCGLHKRIAYNTIMLVGCGPRRLHLGLTLVTSLISMWLINSASTAMMCPIITAILTELEAVGIGSVNLPRSPNDDPDEPPRPSNITIAYFLSAAYAASIGGIGSLVGTGTNLTFKGLFETRFPEGYRIEFVPWLLFNIIPMFMMSFFCWFSLELFYMGLFRPNSAESQIIKQATLKIETTTNVMKQKLQELGKISWNEYGVLVLFIACIGCWLFRKPQFITGWGNLYDKEIADATPAIFVIVFFAAIPASLAFFDFCTLDSSKRPTKITQPLVPWKVQQAKMPWGLLFLLGGGFALADAGKESGMSRYLGDKLGVLNGLPDILVLAISSLFASMATELTSNVAICNIIMPVLMDMSVALGTHPVLFGLPAAVQCSFAFLLPVGTPPNAIAAEAGNIRTKDMFIGGLLLKLYCWLLYVILFPTYGAVFFEQGEFPDWAATVTTENPELYIAV